MNYISILIKDSQVLIDTEDLPKIKYALWINKLGYVRFTDYSLGRKNKKNISLHRFILKAIPGQSIDHINGNKLDNRKSNLRFCSKAQNKWNIGTYSTNTSGYKRVTKRKNKWEASILVKNKYYYLGHFLTKEEAALAYNKAALKYHGEFARLNEIISN